MSEQTQPAREPLPPDDVKRRPKGRRDKDVPTVADFPIGRIIVGEVRERDGFQGFFLCEIVDAYEGKEFATFDQRGLNVFVRVLRVNERKHADMVGHLVKLSIDQGFFWGRGLRLTKMTEGEFEAVVRPSK